MSVGTKVGLGKGELTNSGVINASGLAAPPQAVSHSPLMNSKISPYLIEG
jgi:hypothetical protein